MQPHGAIDWSRLCLSGGTLIAVCASLFLALWLFRLPGPERDAFLTSNSLDGARRTRLFLQLAAAMFVPGLLIGLVVWRFRGDGEYWLSRVALRTSPLMIACFVPTLLSYQQWYAQPLPYLVLLLGVVLLLERLLQHALGASPFAARNSRRPELVSTPPAQAKPSARYLPLGIVALATLGYAVHASYYTILRHQQLDTAGFDLGIFDNLMFNAMHFRPFRSTVAIPDGSYLSNHAEYAMFLFVPLYWLRPGADTLLVLQSSFIALAAIPLYFFATTQLSRPLSAAIACCYLLFAPLHGPNYYDFHWMPQSMVFFFWLFHAIATGKRLPIYVLVPVICAIREDAAFGVIATGLFLILTGFRPVLGGVLTVVSAAWFVLVKFVIMPWAGPWWFADIYKDLVIPGEHGYGSVLKTMLTNPNYFLKQLLNQPKAIYALHLLAPLACLPVRHPALWVLMLPGFIVTLMTTGYEPTLSIAFQYTTSWIPFLFAGAVIALHWRGTRLGLAAVRGSVIAMCFGVLCHSYVFGAVFQHETFVGGFSKVDFDYDAQEQRNYRALKELIAKIPQAASVAATEQEIPHVSTRLDAYTLKVTSGDAEYLLINRPHLDDDARARVRDTLMKTEYGLLARKDDFYLFKKGPVTPDTRAALATLGFSRVREQPRHRDPGSLIGPGGNCVSYQAKDPQIVVLDCAREPKQRWLLSLSGGRLKYQAKPELCLGIPKYKNFEPLAALPCTDDRTRWSFETMAIHNYSEKCADLLGGNRAPGAAIGIWDCQLNDNQKWHVTSQGEVRLAATAKCWTVRGDAPGTPVQLNECDGSEAQRFSFDANKIRRGESCLDVRPAVASESAAGSPRNGWQLQLWPCAQDNAFQEFHLSGPITQRGKCVDSMWAQTTDGSTVGAWDCVNNNNQLFDLHF
ncbi:MAG TPA: DUF2079 domain-containing protein [Polyangiales bacterium]|nr:DUF2079 domain-containing protein [Polyangiales bacterium]